MSYNISLAPMEGIITYIYRNAYYKHYGMMDKYYTPFITSPNLGKKEFQEVDPDKNQYPNLIPQILTNNPETFLSITKELKALGYNTYNLNLGCPSGTVVGKHRGSGLLKYPEELMNFLDNIYSKANGNISIKTRVGYDDINEWNNLLDIITAFPINELIVHPRLRTDYYKGNIRMEAFDYCYQVCCDKNIKLTYNGDLLSRNHIENIMDKYPKLDGVMIGRGILKRPGFVAAFRNPSLNANLEAFHDDIYHGYIEIMSGEKPVLFKMKEIWGFMGYSFDNSEKIIKKIHKSKNLAEYNAIVKEIFSTKS